MTFLDLKDFLNDQDVKNAINSNDWESVYTYAHRPDFGIDKNIYILTEFLLECGIHPELGTKRIPTGFLADSKIDSFKFTDNLEIIGVGAFQNCPNIAELYIPGNIKIIEAYAFANCTDLREVTLDEGIEELRWGCFSFCKNIKEITLPKSIKEIGFYAFGSCRIKAIRYAGNIEDLSKVNIWRDAFQHNGNSKILCADGTYTLRRD